MIVILVYQGIEIESDRVEVFETLWVDGDGSEVWTEVKVHARGWASDLDKKE